MLHETSVARHNIFGARLKCFDNRSFIMLNGIVYLLHMAGYNDVTSQAWSIGFYNQSWDWRSIKQAHSRNIINSFLIQ